jgi:enoyl-CoA hydratase
MYEKISYDVDGSTATITLDRPDNLNTIVPPMLEELEAAVGRAIRDRSVKVIVLQGAGRAFCAGFNFSGGFSHWDDVIATDGEWDAGRDLMMVTSQ